MEQVIAKEAAILTGIGAGSAFGLLVVLMVVVTVGRLLAARLVKSESGQARDEGSNSGERDKALAAVVGATALRARVRFSNMQ